MMPSSDEAIDFATDELHVLNLCGTLFYIDKPTRREIEQFLLRAEKPWETMTIDDLAGMEVLIVANGVNGIWSTSPEQRDRDRHMRDAIAKEDLL